MSKRLAGKGVLKSKLEQLYHSQNMSSAECKTATEKLIAEAYKNEHGQQRVDHFELFAAGVATDFESHQRFD